MQRKTTLEALGKDRFLSDLQSITTSIDAPFSQESVHIVLENYGRNLAVGGITMRTTDRPQDVVNYWAGEYDRVDTISQAVDSGLISSEHPSILLLRSWFSMYDHQPEPSTDFDTAQGLAKTWIWFVELKPVEEILGAEHVPEAFQRHIETFKLLGANFVYHIAVSYRSIAVNLYFHIPSELNSERAAQIVQNLLPGCPIPNDAEMAQMKKCAKGPIILAATLSYPLGTIERICFYAFMVPKALILDLGVGERLERFVRETPCYDAEEVFNLGWSFGSDGERYVKMDIGYCGGFNELMKKLKHS